MCMALRKIFGGDMGAQGVGLGGLGLWWGGGPGLFMWG